MTNALLGKVFAICRVGFLEKKGPGEAGALIVKRKKFNGLV